MHKKLEAVAKLPEVDSCGYFGSYAIGLITGDMSRWNRRDIDVLILTNGEGLETPNIVYENLAKLPYIYQPSVYNSKELLGVITHLSSQTMTKHLEQFYSPFCGKLTKEDFKGKENLWKKVRKKTGIETHNFSEISQVIRTGRYGFLKIIRKYPAKIKELDEQKNKTIRSMRLAVDMITQDEIGQHGHNEDVVKAYFQTFPYKEKDKKKAQKLIEDDFSRISKEKSLENIKDWKYLLEVVAETAEDYVTERLGV